MTNVKSFDAFLYSGEYDLFKTRFNYLKDVVSFFIIIECEIDFQNNYRGFKFISDEKNNQLIYVKVYSHQVAHLKTPKEREYFVRNQIIDVLASHSVGNDDIVHVSDIDEIPRRSIFNMKLLNKIYFLDQYFLYFYINYINVTSPIWASAFIAKYSLIKSSDLNKIRFERTSNKFIIKEGGWHFSYLGGVETVIEKIGKLTDNVGRYKYLTRQEIVNLISNGSDLYGRPFIWGCLSIEDVTKWEIFEYLDSNLLYDSQYLMRRRKILILNLFLLRINRPIFSYLLPRVNYFQKVLCNVL